MVRLFITASLYLLPFGVLMRTRLYGVGSSLSCRQMSVQRNRLFVSEERSSSTGRERFVDKIPTLAGSYE